MHLVKALKILFLVASVEAASVLAEEIVVIINKETELNGLDVKQVRNIFLKKTLISVSGNRWIPVNLGVDHRLRLLFSKMVFIQKPEELESYWNTQYYNGINPPYVVFSEEAMLGFVAATSGAIGYVSNCNVDNRVRIVLRLDIPEIAKNPCNTPPAQ